MRYLGRRLLTLEVSWCAQSDGGMKATLSTLEKLHTRLIKLVGIASFEVLLARALALARTEASWLKPVQVQAGATLTGLSEAAQQQTMEAVTSGCMEVLAQLLGLLVTFVGEAILLGLVQDVWPEVLLDDIRSDWEDPPK